MKFFLHYPSEQLQVARTVYGFLCSLGIEVWFDKEALIAGVEWKRELDAAINSVDAVIALTSYQTISKNGILQREIKAILEKAREMPVGEVFFLNIRVEPVSLPAELSKWQWIDIFADDWRYRLLRAIEKKFIQRNAKMPEPLAFALQQRYQLGSTRIEVITEQTEYADFHASYPLFDLGGHYWDYVNAKIKALVFEDYFGNKQFLKIGFGDRKLQWDFQITEFFREEELLSFEVRWYLDGGGAHPNHGTRTLNFLGRELGSCSIKQLVCHSSEALCFVTKYCKESIKLQIASRGDGFEENVAFFDDENDPWEAYSSFSFNKIGAKFHFSPYQLLAYAYGDFEVVIPWNNIWKHFPEEFKGTAFASFVEANQS